MASADERHELRDDLVGFVVSDVRGDRDRMCLFLVGERDEEPVMIELEIVVGEGRLCPAVKRG